MGPTVKNFSSAPFQSNTSPFIFSYLLNVVPYLYSPIDSALHSFLFPDALRYVLSSCPFFLSMFSVYIYLPSLILQRTSQLLIYSVPPIFKILLKHHLSSVFHCPCFTPIQRKKGNELLRFNSLFVPLHSSIVAILNWYSTRYFNNNCPFLSLMRAKIK